MKNSILFGTLFSAMVIFAGCDIKCPKADTSVLDWFPYENGQTFVLSDNHYATKTFNVDEIVFDHQDGYGYMTDCAVCNNDFIFSISASNLNVNFSGGGGYGESPSVADLYIELCYIDDDNIGLTEYFDFDIILDAVPEQAVYRAKKSEQFYKRIVITKKMGITEIETETGTLFLQNPQEKPNTKNKVMKIRSC